MSHGQHNDRHGSDRRGGSDNHRCSNNNYSGSNSRNSGYGRDQRNRGHQSNRSANFGSLQSRGPSEGYSYPVLTTCGRRYQGECRRAAEPFVQHIDEPNNPITPHPTTPPTSPPQPYTPLSHSSTPIPPQPDTHPSHSSTPITASAQTQSHAQTKEAMLDEYNALITNGTWVLVTRPTNVNVVRSMWLFKHKFNADGSLSRYMARLIENGRNQQQGINCDETFSPVVKPATIHIVLSLAVSRDWHIHQLDVKNAFLHAIFVWAASHAWFQRFASYATRVSFWHSKTDSSLYVFHRGSDIAYLLLNVDDIILTTSSSAFLQWIIASLYNEFAMKDLGSLNYFLGISAQRSASSLFLSQSKFVEEIIKRSHM
nr:ribonuclease H-like domain-containing protein [Tanacetum cinerariifolium]GFA07535.1 ribonuclease H-like domain-containing protein [Tanacetum cinerariifolium]